MPKQFRIWLIIAALILLCLNVFRAQQKHWDHSDPIDFRGLYLGAKMWKLKTPIYNDSIAADFWLSEKAYGEFESSTDFGDEWVSIMVYPPQAFVIAYPISFFHWKTARFLWWMVIGLALLFFCYLTYRKTKEILYPLLVIGSSASFFAISLGQPVLIVVTALLLAVLLREKHPIWAGIFLGIAMIKFNLAIPFALWFLLKSRFKLLIAGAVTSIAMFSMVWISYPDIIHEYSQKVSDYYELIYSIHPRNIYTFSDSELSMMLNYYTDTSVATWKTFNLIGQIIAYGSCMFLFFKKKLNERTLLLGLILSSFAFSYHLSYDVLLFFIPLIIIENTKLRLSIIGLVMILALPLNAIAGSFTILKFNYPILIFLALLVFIFVASKQQIEQSNSHTTDRNFG